MLSVLEIHKVDKRLLNPERRGKRRGVHEEGTSRARMSRSTIIIKTVNILSHVGAGRRGRRGRAIEIAAGRGQWEREEAKKGNLESLAASLGLLDALLAEIDISPSSEAVLLVPGGLYGGVSKTRRRQELLELKEMGNGSVPPWRIRTILYLVAIADINQHVTDEG